MAKAHIKAEIEKVIRDAVKDTSGGFFKGIAGPTMIELQLGNFGDLSGWKEGAKNAIGPANRLVGLKTVSAPPSAIAAGAASTRAVRVEAKELHKLIKPKGFWSDVFRRANTRILKERKLGQFAIKGKATSKSQSGIYFSQNLKSSATDRLTLLLIKNERSKGKTMAQGRPRQIVQAYIKVVWGEFNEYMQEEMDLRYGIKSNWRGATEEDRMRTRYSKSKKKRTDPKLDRLMFGEYVDASHDEHSTSAMLGVQENMADNTATISPKIDASVTIHDLYQLLKLIKVDWNQQNIKKKYGKYKMTNVLRVTAARNPPYKLEDGTSIKFATDVDGLVKHLTEEVEKKYLPQMVKKGGAFHHNTKGSKPVGKQIAEDVALDLIAPLTKKGKPDMRFKVNKGKAKKFKNSKRGANIVKPKPAKRGIKSKISASQSVKNTIGQKNTRKEKGTGVQASTGLAAQLARVKQQIQKRLPQQVKQNMGRPALENRTGGFAGSARLVSLTPAANTIVAKYTYTLTGGGNSKNKTGVYSTFENTGRWPAGYNPKPLISKSIRELAEGRISQKLTTRRV
jgi:hypothetical protein